MGCDLLIFLIVVLAIFPPLINYIKNIGKKEVENESNVITRNVLNEIDYKKRKTPIQTNLAGVTFENRLEVIKKLFIGDIVLIIPDEDNPYDENALAVYSINRVKIGYLNKELAEKLADDFSYTDPNYYVVEGKIIDFTFHQGSISGVKIEFIPPDEESGKNKFLTETLIRDISHTPFS